MDKEFAKKLLAAEGLPVGPYAVVRAGAALPRTRTGSGSGCRCSSSRPAAGRRIGISRVDDWAALRGGDRGGPGGRRPRCWSRRRCRGREIESAVLEGIDGAAPDASVPAEILLAGGREFYDFEAKYLDDVLRPGHPGGPAAGVTAAAAAAGGAGVHRAGLRRPGPGRLLRRPGRAGRRSTRSTRCPGSRRSRCSRGCGRRPGWTTRPCSTGSSRPRCAGGQSAGSRGRGFRRRRCTAVDSRATGALASAAGTSTSTYTGAVHDDPGRGRAAPLGEPAHPVDLLHVRGRDERRRPRRRRSAASRRVAPGRHVRRGRVDRPGRQVAELGRQRRDQLLAGPLLPRPARRRGHLIGGSAAAAPATAGRPARRRRRRAATSTTPAAPASAAGDDVASRAAERRSAARRCGRLRSVAVGTPRSRGGPPGRSACG